MGIVGSLMRAVAFTTPGLVENLHITLRKTPILKDNECLVKVFYSAINRADTLQRKGLYPPPPDESDILGLEAAGRVCLTNDKSIWKKNDRVMALLGGGGNAEYVAVNEKNLIKIPDSMSLEEASAITEVWLTAFQLIYWISDVTKNANYNLDRNVKDTKFLVHAGASGVGTSLIQILKNILNVDTVFATCGSETKKNFLENRLNVTKAFNYKNSEEENFHSHILNMTENKGVDVVFDCVGGSYLPKNLECLNIDGELILYGLLGGGNVEGNILAQLLKKRIHVKSTTLRGRSIDYKHNLIRDFESKILKHFESKKIFPIIDHIYDLEDIQKAHARMESNQNIGKIILKVRTESDDFKSEF